jgi:hypothetical protein
MPRRVRILLVLLLSAAALGAQAPSAAKTPYQVSLEALLDRIASLPPEYKADLGFAVLDAAADKLTPAQKRALLDDIFHSAARSRYPYPLNEAAGFDLPVALLDGSTLDTLQIQARAIDHALPATPQFARELFEEVSFPLNRASCSDANVEDVSTFYTIAAKLVADPRIRKISGEDKATYLLSLAAGIKIPAQVAPFAELISNPSLPADQLSQLVNALVAALNSTAASDREMNAAEKGGELTEAMQQLSARLAQAGIAPARLLAAYRGFLLRGLTVESCADDSLDRAAVAEHFNALLPRLASPDLAPLTAALLKPQAQGASAPRHKTNSYNEPMMNRLYRIAAAQVARSTDEARSGQTSLIAPDPSDVEEIIRYATSADPVAADCPDCNFESKGALLHALVQLFPAGSQLDKVVYADIDFLSMNDMQKDEPPAWLHFFKELLNASRRASAETKAAMTAKAQKGKLPPLSAPSAAAAQIRKILRSSADPVISAYMSAEDLLHPPYLTTEQQMGIKP